MESEKKEIQPSEVQRSGIFIRKEHLEIAVNPAK
jgi:hypothetical protein